MMALPDVDVSRCSIRLCSDVTMAFSREAELLNLKKAPIERPMVDRSPCEVSLKLIWLDSTVIVDEAAVALSRKFKMVFLSALIVDVAAVESLWKEALPEAKFRLELPADALSRKSRVLSLLMLISALSALLVSVKTIELFIEVILALPPNALFANTKLLLTTKSISDVAAVELSLNWIALPVVGELVLRIVAESAVDVSLKVKWLLRLL